MAESGWDILETGRWNEAVVAFSRAVEQDPELAVAQFNVGASLAQSGDVRGSVKPFQRALDLGLERAAPALERAVQVLFVAAADDGTARQAVEAMLDARTSEDLEDALDRFPFIALPDFLHSFAGAEQRPAPGE
jgi:tetratricopeptide (TPR) repeat protein